MLYLEARNKRTSLFPPYSVYAPEALVNLYDQTVLWWLNPLFLKAYNSNLQKLYRIDSDLSSESVEASFHGAWDGRELPGVSS